MSENNNSTFVELTFKLENKTIEDLLISSVDFGFLEEPRDLFVLPIDFSGEYKSLEVNFDYAIEGQVGLGVDIDLPSLGEIDLTYPISTTLNLPNFVEPGNTFTIGTGSNYTSKKPSLTGESLNFGSTRLDLITEIKPGGFTDISFLNAFGRELIPFNQNLTWNGIPLNRTTLIEIGASSEDFELIDDIEITFSPPLGVEDTVEGGISSPGTLDNIILTLEEPLASISTNPFELIGKIPALNFLDALQEDEDVKFSVFGNEYTLTAEYTLLGLSINGGYGLVQEFQFDPDNVAVTFSFNGEQQKGILGDNFNFTMPNNISGSPLVEITYELTGDIKYNYALAPIGSIGYEILGGSINLKDESSNFVDLDFGPVLEDSWSGSLNVGKLPLLNGEIILKPEDLGIVKQLFRIKTEPEPIDIVFVIDSTGSMSDDIASVKNQARDIIDQILEVTPLARFAVVTYKDPGETFTNLSFTSDPLIAKSGIDSISVSGGGDFEEGVYSGLLHALKASDGMGNWRESPTQRSIILIGDAPGKDIELREEVIALANSRSIAIDEDILTETFSVNTATKEDLSPSLLRTAETSLNEEILSVLPVKIFSIPIGNNSVVISEFQNIAETTTGRSFPIENADELVPTIVTTIQEIINENQAPINIFLTNDVVDENQPFNAMIGVFSSQDPDGDTEFIYSLVSGEGDTDNEIFTINQNELLSSQSFDFEAKNSYSIRVQTNDGNGGIFEKAFTVTIADVNEISDGGRGNSFTPPTMPPTTTPDTSTPSRDPLTDRVLTLSEDNVQILYLPLTGRPADPLGLDFWRNAIAENNISYSPSAGDTLANFPEEQRLAYQTIINDFAGSSETVRLFGENDNLFAINLVYNNVFNRPAEEVGLNYWNNALETGDVSLATLALEVSLGASGSDITVLSNKVVSAELFMERLESLGMTSRYAGEEAEKIGFDFLSSIGNIRASQTQVDDVINSLPMI